MGRRRNKRQRRLWALHDFSTGHGLEIGPLHNRAMYPEDADVRYLDVFDRAQLLVNYAEHENVAKDRIPEIDFALFDGERVRTIPEAVGPDERFDWVVAAHVLEHVPDVIGWLDQVAQVTVDGGRLLLVVPDRRYCFDVHRPGTTLGQMLLEHELGVTVPSVRAVYDYKRGHAPVAAADAWAGRPPTYDRRIYDLPTVLEQVERARRGEYIDSHVWTFTSGTLVEQLVELREIGRSEWKVEQVRATRRDEVEFFVVLQRLPRDGDWAPLLVDEVQPAQDLPDWLAQTVRWQTGRERLQHRLQRKQARVDRLEREVRRLRTELERTRSSPRWRAGGVVTAPLRLARRARRRARRPART